MSNLQVIEELCGICADLAGIVVEQQMLLSQHDALGLEDRIEQVKGRYDALLGHDEWPDSTPERSE